MVVQIQVRRDTAANWTSANPTLADGEPGFETNTRKWKVGDGSTAWTSLPYVGITNPMTTQDDIIVGGASGVAGRLAKGSDGQVLTVDPSTHHLVWATPGSGSSPLTTKGDLWGYSTVDTRIPVGTDGDVLTADSGASRGVSWQTPSGGGGGASHSYIGYNVVGGSHGGMTQYRVYYRAVSLAASGLITSIGAYFTETGNHVGSLSVAVYTDNAGVPDSLLAYTANRDISIIPEGGPGTAVPGWRHVPVGLWVPAGDYWLAIQDVGGNPLELYTDAGGHDPYHTPSGPWFAEGTEYTLVDSGQDICIRADFMS